MNNLPFLKFLLLEDSETDAELVQRILLKYYPGHINKVVINREEYITALSEFQPDIILSDNALPQFSAKEALEINQLCPANIPFIMVTGTVSEEFAAGIIKLGADDYILKDRLARLPMAIDAALKQKLTEKEKEAAAIRLVVSEEKYRSLVERITDGFIAMDNNWCLTYVNLKAGQIFNLPPAGLIGKNIYKVFPAFSNHPIQRAFETSLCSQQQVHSIDFFTSYDIWIENNIYPSLNGLSVVFRDITESYLQKEKISAQYNALQNITWKQSHLMRSPLANLKGLVLALKEDPTNPVLLPYFEGELEKLDIVIAEMVAESSTISSQNDLANKN